MAVYFDYFWWIFLCLFGLSMGSFLNVVIYRLPLDKSIVMPGSSCPACAAPIKWYDNIPLLSYILLRGRCRYCNESISGRYPLIEALTGALTVLLFVQYGAGTQTAIYLLLMLAMIAVAFIDSYHMIIPDEISLGGAAAGLGLSFVPGGVTPLDAVIGAAAGAASLGIIRWAHMKITGIEGMGLGDVKLAAAIGAFLGWYALPLVFFASAVFGLLTGGLFLIARRKGARTPMPFGTFLAIGTVAHVFFGSWSTSWLIRYMEKFQV